MLSRLTIAATGDEQALQDMAKAVSIRSDSKNKKTQRWELVAVPTSRSCDE